MRILLIRCILLADTNQALVDRIRALKDAIDRVSEVLVLVDFIITHVFIVT